MSWWSRLLGVRVEIVGVETKTRDTNKPYDWADPLCPPVDQTAVTRQERREEFVVKQPEYQALKEPEDYPTTFVKLEEKFDPESKPPERKVRKRFKSKWIGVLISMGKSIKSGQ